MSDILCVTSRKLCHEDFLIRLRRIVAAGPRAVILREKDLGTEEYCALAHAALAVCQQAGVPLFLSGHAALAAQMGCAVQLRFAETKRLSRAGKLPPCGVSIHSAEEAAALRGSGARYLVAGHIWDTACKAGLPGRGIDFLRAVADAAGNIPVYAIGGITPARMPAVYTAGAAGACVMSALMTCADPAAYLRQFHKVKCEYMNDKT